MIDNYSNFMSEGFRNGSAYFNSLPQNIQNRLISSGIFFSSDEEMQSFVSKIIGAEE